MNENTSATGTETPTPRWQPVNSTQRRLLGVLAEKAKTTPDQYPLTLNALRSGSNQKSNRYPVMELDEDAIQDALDELRQAGAVGEVFGSGRVPRYRHYLYDWLGVNAVELAVMAELLLRGPQTEGELRGRAARMEAIKDLSELRPVLDGLKSRGLVIPLTPAGRGHVVTHALYPEKELERIRQRYASDGPETDEPPPAPQSTPSAPVGTISSSKAPSEEDAVLKENIDSLRRELAELRQTVESLANRVSENEAVVDRVSRELGI